MNFRLQNRFRSGRAASVAIVVAAMLTVLPAANAAAGKTGGTVRAAPATMAAKTGPSSFNHVANEVRPSKPPSVAKEPCRGRHCPNHWPNHQH